MKIRIDIKDLGTNEALEAIARKASNLQPAMRQAGLYMERETKLGFARESDPDNRPWSPLKPATLRQKKTRAILRETSTLAGGISLTRVTNSSATVAATAGSEYSIYHQTGTSKMPARPFIGIGDRHIPKIVKIFDRHLNG